MTREHSARCAAAVLAMLRKRLSLRATLAVIDGRQMEIAAIGAAVSIDGDDGLRRASAVMSVTRNGL